MSSPSPRLFAVLCLGSVALSAGCGGSGASSTVEPHPTVVLVSPDEFPVTPPCREAEGALRSYVATLTDLTASTPDAPQQDPQTSAPAPCTQPIAFEKVTLGHVYIATIQGYDHVASSVGAEEPGHWSTLCGGRYAPNIPNIDVGEPKIDPQPSSLRLNATATRAESEATITVNACDPWTLAMDASETPTRVTVSIPCELDTLSLSAPAGEQPAPTTITQFSVRRDGKELGSAACGDTLTVDSLTNGDHVDLDVFATLAEPYDGQSQIGTSCHAIAEGGVTLPASCDPFGYQGVIRFSLSDLLSDAGASCDSSLTALTLTLPATATSDARSLSFDATDCTGQASFDALAPGSYDVRASVTRFGVAPIEFACSAEVEPGLVAALTCQAP